MRFAFIIPVFLAAAALSAAHATPPGNNGGGHGGCGVGQQTNGCGGTANAGAISASRAEARAKAAAIAAQRQSLNSTITNTVNTAPVKVRVNVTAPATSAPVEAKVAPSEQPIKQAAAAEKSDQLVVAPAQARDPVATAYAAPLIATNGTCMGSSSGGAQGAALGVTFATTWTDDGCDARYDAQALEAVGMRAAAIARLCQREGNRKAMAAAGKNCPDEPARAERILGGQAAGGQQQPMPWQAGG